MKKLLAVSLVSLLISSLSLAGEGHGKFPTGPDLTETPGQFCTSPTELRYPEKIAYCKRNVDSYTKNAIIQKYDSLFGYSIRQMNRGDFKIDHLIPLCAGGANTEENLWPQHKSVYNITDPLEPIVCEKMAAGKLKQADAVKLIMQAKMHLDQVPEIINQVKRL
ncbi:MAG: hypothetical protein K2Q18_13790 [Bdellovibrionales bacterium]|nr:hypothetical protein [Bdellovibrionales bacterium]